VGKQSVSNLQNATRKRAVLESVKPDLMHAGPVHL
jgi:hypothetical protein